MEAANGGAGLYMDKFLVKDRLLPGMIDAMTGAGRGSTGCRSTTR